MLTHILQATVVTKAQFWTGAAIVGGIILLSYLVTKYTKYGGGSDYGTGGSEVDDIDIT
ncbi:MAG: hypothetical protein ABJN95_13560 [Maribacter sp.]|uniref:hypothetical protein n=1 Tax=Maribacter sp. TaxID=1897614 RepID=UPI00329A06B7